MDRRKFLKNGTVGAAGMGLLAGLYTWQVEPFWVEFVHRRMPIQNLPDELVGKTMMHISDVHIGNAFDYQYIIDAFNQAQLQNPDFVVYTGDYVSYKNSEQFQQLSHVLKSFVKGKIETIAILGNHDYGLQWSEQEVADKITDQLTSAGIKVLVNEKLSVEGLTFLGIDDYWSLNFQPHKVMNLYNGEEATVALCHNPDVCDLDVWNNYKGWILSGHTHGGQCKAPFLTPPILPVKNKRYSAGEIDLHDGRRLYINRAVGHLFQVRFNVRPEITTFELSQA